MVKIVYMYMEKIKSTIKTTPLSDAYYNCNFMSVILLRRNPKEHKKNIGKTIFIQQFNQENKRKPQVPFDLNSIHMNRVSIF